MEEKLVGGLLSRDGEGHIKTLIEVCNMGHKTPVEIRDLREHVDMSALQNLVRAGYVERTPLDHGIFYSPTQEGIGKYLMMEGIFEEEISKRITSNGSVLPRKYGITLTE